MNALLIKGSSLYVTVLITLLLARPYAHAADEGQTAPIPPDAAVKPEAVKPLVVEYYNFQKVNPIGRPGIDSMKIARDFVKGHKADTTVVIPSGHVDFPVGADSVRFPQNKPIGDFVLGPFEMEKRLAAEKENKKHAVPAELKVRLSTRNIFIFKGFIRVEKAGVYDFRIPADDGFELTIGGVVVGSAVLGGHYDPMHKASHCRAEFVNPGIYPVRILHYDKARHGGIAAYSTVVPKGPIHDLGGKRRLNRLQFLIKAPAKSDAVSSKSEGHPLRDWTSGFGDTIKARLVSRDGDTVVLKKENGESLKLKFQQLAKKDQDYLNSLPKEKKHPLREWTSALGNKMKAQLISRDGNTVVLKKEDGKSLKLKVQQLSKKDQDYLKTLDK